ncbi:hypothetical protein L218DRAFT_942533 [Marasmius fiardii PR-910]|nr:hypothetical protein L218DRAFT_942533 [Marasmius fiardii PR-910]
MSDGSAPDFTIPTHFDNPTQPRPEFTPTPFDAEPPTGIPPIFNKDNYPPLDESKRIKRALQDFEDLKEEHEEQEEGRKAAFEADLQNWEQEEELRQQNWVDYIARAQGEVEERKKEEQRRASAVADASPDVLVSAENLDDMEPKEPSFRRASKPGISNDLQRKKRGGRPRRGRERRGRQKPSWTLSG